MTKKAKKGKMKECFVIAPIGSEGSTQTVVH